MWRSKSRRYAFRFTGWLHVVLLLFMLMGSKAKQDHYIKKCWPVRNEYVPGKMNIKHICVVEPKTK